MYKMRQISTLLSIPLLCFSVTATAQQNLDSLANEREKLSLKQKLGKMLYQDKNLSLNRNQSCASCHSLVAVENAAGKNSLVPGFVDPVNVLTGSAVSNGSITDRSGSLNAPTAAYAAFSPFFHWDEKEGLYVGGQFYNGRAATLAEQAKGPFLNPVEMAMPNKWSVVSRVKEKRKYKKLFKRIYNINIAEIPFYPGKHDTKYYAKRAHSPIGVNEVYDRIADAIAAFEKSRHFNKFNSKFDFYLAGMTQLTPQETEGLALFEGDKAKCSACHVSNPTIATDGSQFPPLFTDFTYDNIGLPRNMNIPGQPEPDLGLGGREEIAAGDTEGNEIGKHKVLSLRNVELTAPYGHNGVMQTLEEIVHFYNTRDVLGRVSDNTEPGFGSEGWPEPEVLQNVNTDELGDLRLTAEEEAALVAFMKTLTDDYPSWGNDPNIPPGTPSPFANTPFPPMP